MTPSRKAVFDPNAINDEIDEFFALPTTQPAEPAANLTEPTPAKDPVRGLPSARDSRGERRTVRAAQPPNSDRSRIVTTPVKREPKDSDASAPASSSPPEVSIEPVVYQTLRELTLRERRTDPTNARPYGVVVLDAIDQAADRLATHWHSTDSPPTSHGSLFQRPTTRRRRRHATPPARVPLAGIAAIDVQRLDELAEAWNAGNRSIMVEQALRYYLSIDTGSSD